MSTSSYMLGTGSGPLGFGFTYNSKAPVASGLRGSYFDTLSTTTDARLVRTDPIIDFNWAAGAPVNDSTFPVDNFGLS